MSNKAIKVPKPKKQRQKAKEKEANKKSILSPWRIASGIATLVGILGLVTFLPHITTTISDPVDPNNPFSASVTITNTGVFTLDEVEPFFGLRKMTFGGPAATRTWLGPAQQYTRFGIRGWHASSLDPDKNFTFALDEIWGNQPNLRSADVAVIVQYQVPLVHWKREKTFPYSAIKQTNGRFYWYATAPDTRKSTDVSHSLPPL